MSIGGINDLSTTKASEVIEENERSDFPAYCSKLLNQGGSKA